ncbi:acetoin utilization deacetylase [Tupanvirus soda lake]|uniref:Acetoin utilization deacetylase n=2 Tax=Tupanvirus TaxID=2094720 RepID=A0A6N1P2C8_9VIRU|nr:acetoin utilization deacetylase [Tupanvirus soda lake]QKU35181.1 acetoin utilization deacetylase [Tupanvirus soda lake]
MAKLTIVTTPMDTVIVRKEESFNTTNKPFTRQYKIFKKLEETFLSANYLISNFDVKDIRSVLETYPCVSCDYLDFLENAFKSHLESNDNDEYVSPYDGGLVNYCFSKTMPVKKSNKLPYYMQCGLYSNDFTTSIFDYTNVFALQSAYNGIIAANSLRNDSVIYCLNVFPGHHAAKDFYSGYCFLNNAAICAYELLKKYNKVAILDIDYHHGDGTQKIFYDDPRVLTISIHGDPASNYPFYVGYIDEIGEGYGEAYNYNYPLPKGSDINAYINKLTDALEIISVFDTDILVIAFGGDTYNNDPQGGFCLNLDDYKTIGSFIRKSVNKPIIITQEGGYYLDDIDKIVSNFVESLIK